MYTLHIETVKQQHFTDITAQVAALVRKADINSGICYIFCPHTTAAITLNENWDPDVQHDLGLALNEIAPQRTNFKHAEGNSPAHVKAGLMGNDHSIMVEEGHLILGRWQGIYLAEFDGPRTRTIYVKFINS